MSKSKKEGLFSKIFGAPKSSCCNMRIEEVAEEEAGKPEERRPSSCCGGASGAPADAGKDAPSRVNAKEEK